MVYQHIHILSMVMKRELVLQNVHQVHFIYMKHDAYYNTTL